MFRGQSNFGLMPRRTVGPLHRTSEAKKKPEETTTHAPVSYRQIFAIKFVQAGS
jgi:hypothetical protein